MSASNGETNGNYPYQESGGGFVGTRGGGGRSKDKAQPKKGSHKKHGKHGGGGHSRNYQNTSHDSSSSSYSQQSKGLLGDSPSSNQQLNDSSLSNQSVTDSVVSASLNESVNSTPQDLNPSISQQAESKSLSEQHNNTSTASSSYIAEPEARDSHDIPPNTSDLSSSMPIIEKGLSQRNAGDAAAPKAKAAPSKISLHIDPGLQLPDTVTILEGPSGGKVYLVGTAHFSEQSKSDVSETIRKTQPNVVMVELCNNRVNIMSLDEKTIMEEASSINVTKMHRYIQQHGVLQGVMYMLLLSLSAHLTKELGMAPGGEFRAAYEEARRVTGCQIQLGDRPVDITLRRALASLTFWQKLRLGWGIVFNNEKITKDDVEKCKQRDLLEEMLQEMTGEFPAMSRVFVGERDIYLTYSLQLAARPVPSFGAPARLMGSTVVGVVGIGHVPGIVKYWGKVNDDQIPPLLHVPGPSTTSIVIRKGVKYSFYLLVGYGAVKYLVPRSVTSALVDAVRGALGGAASGGASH